MESIKGINSGEFIIANFLQNLSCLLATSVSKQYRSHISLIKSTSLPFTWNISDKTQNQSIQHTHQYKHYSEQLLLISFIWSHIMLLIKRHSLMKDLFATSLLSFCSYLCLFCAIFCVAAVSRWISPKLLYKQSCSATIHYVAIKLRPKPKSVLIQHSYSAVIRWMCLSESCMETAGRIDLVFGHRGFV